MTDAQVKFAMAQGQTVVMKLTYATGPEDMDTKDIVLNDGGLGADVMRFDAQTNGINTQWGYYYVEQPPALVRISGEVQPIAIEPPVRKQPSGIIPRKEVIIKDPRGDGNVTGKKSPPKIVENKDAGDDRMQHDMPTVGNEKVSFDLMKPNIDRINKNLTDKNKGISNLKTTISITANPTAKNYLDNLKKMLEKNGIKVKIKYDNKYKGPSTNPNGNDFDYKIKVTGEVKK
jgi:hypothetical protein